MPYARIAGDAELQRLVISEFQRLARKNIAPSQERFDALRQPGLPVAKTIVRRLGTSWAELARQAGLLPRGNQKVSAYPALPPTPCGGLPVIESSRRVREFYVRQQDGTVRRIVQESVSLR